MYKSLLLMIIFFGSIFQISAQNRQVTLNAGTYSALTTYSASDVVLKGNSYYISLIANNNNNDPAASPTDWKLIGNSFTATGAFQIWFQIPSFNSVNLKLVASTGVNLERILLSFRGL